MAVITTAVIAGVAVAGGVYKTVKGAKEERDAKNAIAGYERQGLENAYEDARVSTLGADLRREELGRTIATGTEALRGAGARGLIGGLGRLTQQSNTLNREIASDLDRQQTELERRRAEDEARIRSIREQRDISNLAGLGAKFQEGRRTQASGLQDISSGIGTAAGGFGGASAGASEGARQAASASNRGGIGSGLGRQSSQYLDGSDYQYDNGVRTA